MKKLILVIAVIFIAVSAMASVEVTVYNNGYALVKDVRSMDFKKGINSYNFENVASLIEPQSVLFKTLGETNAIEILEQNYRYDLMNSQTILNKLIGERVILKDDSEGTLLSAPGLNGNDVNAGTIVQKDDGNIVLYPEIKATKKMPEGLIARPTLSWLIDSGKNMKESCEVSYITGGIGWNADYVCLVNAGDTKADLNGWVTLNNNSGTEYRDAKLSLIAGDVRRVQPQTNDYIMEAWAMSAAKSIPAFQEQSFFEYHIYKLQRATTLADRESKQISLLTAAGVNVNKKLLFAPKLRNMGYSMSLDGKPQTAFATSTDTKVGVTLEIINSKENNMGMPLPKGTVKVYKIDSDGSQQFIGEDAIDHTPKDEKIDLFVGNAFDVVGEYKMTNYKRISANTIEETYSVEIRNHKDTPVVVDFYESVWGDWKITDTDGKYNKIDANTIDFPISVSANGKKTVVYTILTKY